MADWNAIREFDRGNDLCKNPQLLPKGGATGQGVFSYTKTAQVQLLFEGLPNGSDIAMSMDLDYSCDFNYETFETIAGRWTKVRFRRNGSDETWDACVGGITKGGTATIDVALVVPNGVVGAPCLVDARIECSEFAPVKRH